MFDPALPAQGSRLQSAVIRSQLTSLKALIDAISAITQAQVDGVTTLNPGEPAAASATINGDTLSFTFAIPQGQAGAQGSSGGDGPIGPQGPPFAQAIVDAVNTLPAGDPATVSVSYDGTYVRFTFSIPQGQSGPPGEVTTSQMDTAISAALETTALNPTSVSIMSISFSDPPTSAELYQVQDKYNELLTAIRRVV
jgi:hypothetical protein